MTKFITLCLSAMLMSGSLLAMDAEPQYRTLGAYKQAQLNKKFFKAFYAGSKRKMAWYLFRGADVNARDGHAGTALSGAIFHGDKKMCEFLIAKGADVNGQEDCRSTPLHDAVWWDNKELCELLIANGALVNKRDEDGSTVLMALDSKKGNSAAICQLLIDNGAEVNARALDGETALINAANRGLKEACELLIAHGANINAIYCAKTPLMIAASRGHEEIGKLLIAHGARLTLRDWNGLTALGNAADYIVRSGNNHSRALCKLLIDAMLKPTQQQIQAAVAIQESLKLNPRLQTVRDTRSLIAKSFLEASVQENKKDIKKELESIWGDDALRDELLHYLSERCS